MNDYKKFSFKTNLPRDYRDVSNSKQGFSNIIFFKYVESFKRKYGLNKIEENCHKNGNIEKVNWKF